MAITADRLLEAARGRLHEYGIELEIEPPSPQDGARHPDPAVDPVATLSRADARARYAVLVREPMTLSSLVHGAGRQPAYPLLVVGDRVTRRSAASFRAAGIQFVDTLGNAYVAFDGVLVDVRGRTEPPVRVPESGGYVTRQQRPANIFSSRRSQVILALLAWPEIATGKVRAIAHAAGVSVGQAHDALAQLQQSGFLDPTSRRLDRADELLDYWTAAYPTGLGRRLEIATYSGDASKPARSPNHEQPVYLSSESAEGVDIARPATLTLYVDTLDPRLPIMNRWTSSPERPPNVFVRRKFWVSPRPHKGRSSTNKRNAPWPLVYADLVATGDARLGEVAKAWRARHARSDEV